MSLVSSPAARAPKRRAKRKRVAFFARLKRWLKALRRGWRRVRALPKPLRIALVTLFTLTLFAASDLVYQVAKKPTEMFSPVAAALIKSPSETWRDYGALFREDATATIRPVLLAALAQVEGSGDPLAQTYWRWRFSLNPFAIYAPASSAVGMYQMTNATFAQARRYCIRDHRAVSDCWFNGLYSRLSPGDAVELTAAYLDRSIAAILAHHPKAHPTLREEQNLAAIIHLCGAGAGDEFARRGFRLRPHQRCGDEEAAAYVARVIAMSREFTRLAAR